MREMSVSEAIQTRRSCRAFLSKPVPPDAIDRIVDLARWAPSGGNLQPWIVYMLCGTPLSNLVGLIAQRHATAVSGEGTEYPIYPPKLHEPYRSRRYKCGENMYSAAGLTRENSAGRQQQRARNLAFFGAPVGLFFFVDRALSFGQWADVGMFMQNIMLLARAEGLDTCAQESWAAWHKTVSDFLQVPGQLMLFCGMAVGYADTAASINNWRTERAAPSEFLRTIR